MVESVFRGGLAFLEHVGVYDVVLPFLLVFTLVYALLEKTKILGVQADPYSKDKREYPKRNLNSMVAFVIAFFVIASSKLVELINKTVSQVFILVLLSVMFMLVVGTFGKDEEFAFTKSQQMFFAWIMGIAIVFIFLNAMGWLELAYNFLKNNWSTEIVSSVLFIGGIAIFVAIISKPTKPPNTVKKKETEE